MIPIPFDERELLARLIECEAGGEGEHGMTAVGSVVMNRVHVPFGEYSRVSDGSVRKIVFQPGQFACAVSQYNGKPNPRNIYNMRPQQIHYDIADYVLGGGRINNLGQALWFYAPRKPECKPLFPTDEGFFVLRLGEHCFYNPTEAYINF